MSSITSPSGEPDALRPFTECCTFIHKVPDNLVYLGRNRAIEQDPANELDPESVAWR